MHITLEADYTVRTVLFLAQKKQRMDARSISENTGVSLKFALKILRKLVASGILRSYIGVKGGYELSLSPEEITLKRLLEIAEDGEFVLNRCLKDPALCSRPSGGYCPVHEAFGEISQSVRDQLAETTIETLLHRTDSLLVHN